MSTVAHRLTYDELRQLPDDGKRYELIDGRLIEVPSPSRAHQDLQVELTLLLGTLVKANKSGKVYSAVFDVRLSPFHVVQPDLLFVRADRLDIVGRNFVDGPPDLVIEILSPSTREHDLETKMELYARFGVPEYWAFDIEAEAVLVHTLVNGRYEVAEQVGGVLRSAVVPGFAIDLAELFASVW